MYICSNLFGVLLSFKHYIWDWFEIRAWTSFNRSKHEASSSSLIYLYIFYNLYSNRTGLEPTFISYQIKIYDQAWFFMLMNRTRTSFCRSNSSRLSNSLVWFLDLIFTDICFIINTQAKKSWSFDFWLNLPIHHDKNLFDTHFHVSYVSLLWTTPLAAYNRSTRSSTNL